MHCEVPPNDPPAQAGSFLGKHHLPKGATCGKERIGQSSECGGKMIRLSRLGSCFDNPGPTRRPKKWLHVTIFKDCGSLPRFLAVVLSLPMSTHSAGGCAFPSKPLGHSTPQAKSQRFFCVSSVACLWFPFVFQFQAPMAPAFVQVVESGVCAQRMELFDRPRQIEGQFERSTTSCLLPAVRGGAHERVPCIVSPLRPISRRPAQ